ncbi:MAG: hypothetical protein ABI467_24400 [Kofleriaceae bacterium]
MEVTYKVFWTALHGMALGAVFLLLFSGGVVAILNLGSVGLTPDATRRPLRRLAIASWCMAMFAWGAVILGTYCVYPWYRATPPAGSTLTSYPKYLLLSRPQTAAWHGFGMEWKEHIAWLAPMLITAVAAVVTCHGRLLVRDARLRRVVLVLFTAAFFCASVAGVCGALLNKAAPTR